MGGNTLMSEDTLITASLYELAWFHMNEINRLTAEVHELRDRVVRLQSLGARFYSAAIEEPHGEWQDFKLNEAAIAWRRAMEEEARKEQ
jgi:precorrin-4 methylase